jgi:Maltokinase N-terminal cap domain
VAIVYRTTLRPSKLELLSSWAPRQPWWPSGAQPELSQVGAYRFDDPGGEVGIETLLVRTANGVLLQAPVTYRGKPLPGADEHLVGTGEHGVLGPRWVYDGCGDPVYVTALATAILTGGTQALLQIVTPEGAEERPPNVQVKGSGRTVGVVPPIESVEYKSRRGPAVMHAPGLRVELLRVPGGQTEPGAGAFVLQGTWDGQASPALLAIAELI